MSTLKSQIHSILKKFGKDSMNDVIDTLNQYNVFETIHNLKKK